MKSQKKQQQVDQVFKILLDPIVESGLDERVVLSQRFNTHTELVNAIRNCQIKARVHVQKSLQSY